MTNSKFECVSDWPRLFYAELCSSSDPQKAIQMAAYMKGHFLFLGVPKPLRADIQRAHWGVRPRRAEVIPCIHELWSLPHREAQYLAMDLLKAESKHWNPKEALPALEQWITTRSWWDSVDTLAVHGVGALL